MSRTNDQADQADNDQAAPAGADQADAPGAAPDLAALDAIAHQAGQAAPGAAAAPGQVAEAVSSNASELLGALQMARMMVAPMFAWWPDFGQVWGDPTLQGIAQSGGAIMDKHGWTTGGLWGEFGPYAALAMATLPPAFVTVQAIKAQKAEAERKAREGAPGVGPQ